MQTAGGFRTSAGEPQIRRRVFSAPALGTTTAIMAALTDNAKYRVRHNKAAIWSAPSGVAKKVTATAGGTAADIKAIQVTVTGTDSADAPLTEVLPVFTVNTSGTVTSVGSFKTVTEIRIPAHDGLAATTSIGVDGGAVNAVLPAFTDKGVEAYHNSDAAINDPAPARNVTATAGGTAGDIKAIQVIVNGTNENDVAISETLPAFTVDTAGTVVGNKAFKSVTSIEVPPHDGVAATTAVGTGAKLGLGKKIGQNTVLNAYLANVKEGTAPTIATSATDVESNTATLNSALDGTDVIIDFIS